ncbi:MAG: restriction endonuclease subunit S [Muribaculaceae bacterium]
MNSIFTAYSDLHQASFPANWEICRFKDLISSSRAGVWGEEANNDDNDIICYRMADFDYPNYCLKFDNLTLRNVLPSQQENRLLHYGDLLLEKSGGGDKMPVGRVVFVNSNQPAVCSNFIQALTINDKASSRFILYLFNSIYSNRVNTLFFNQTTGIQNLQTAYYLSQEIALPPVAEQEAIAEYLDKECEKIGRNIELLERKADAYKRLRRSIINRAVTRGLNLDVPLKPSASSLTDKIPEHWNERRIKDFFIETSIKGFPKEPMLCATQSRGVIPQSMYENRVVAALTGLENMKLVEKGNFVISLRSFQGGIEYAHYRGIISAAYTILGLDGNNSKEYFRYFFKSPTLIKLMKKCVTGIREGQNINYTVLKYEKVPLPPYIEQQQIAAYLDEKCGKIDAIIEKIGTQIERLKELKRSLINEVVTGKRAIIINKPC